VWHHSQSGFCTKPTAQKLSDLNAIHERPPISTALLILIFLLVWSCIEISQNIINKLLLVSIIFHGREYFRFG